MNVHFLLNHSSKLSISTKEEILFDRESSNKRSCSTLSALAPVLKRTRYEEDSQWDVGCKSPTSVTRSYSVQYLLLPPVEIPSAAYHATSTEKVGMKTMGLQNDTKLELETELTVNSQSTVARNPSFDVGFRPQDPAYRLAQARLIGVRHRNNERLRTAALEYQVEELIGENQELCDTLGAMKIISSNEGEYIDEELEPKLEHEVSSNSSKILGTKKIDGESALIVLELIMLRRNLHRPNKLTVECAAERDVEEAVWKDGVSAETLHKAGEMHHRWAAFEAGSGRASERPNTFKRCTRCGKARMAGRGHARSFCDDGFKVGSKIPYTKR